jgi:asparagine synthase (glutamine-hydrolysing)
MSAIAGICQKDGQPVLLESGMAMMKELAGFPADELRIWCDDPVFMGCLAQWITPESVGETLPYYDSQRRLAITADAILDNRSELFERIQVAHAERAAMPDSQLILLAYAKWGEDSPKYLVGDFAYVIWDASKRKLFGARDFTGNRTLYYRDSDGEFAWCTTIRPLLALPGSKPAPDEHWMAEYLANPGRLETVDPFSTAYRGIRQVPPSHSVILENNRVRFVRYHTFEETPEIRFRNETEYEEAFRDVFGTAVRSRLRTFRQVGSFLSGGLDSGAVASFAAPALREDGKTLHTYSAIPLEGFENWTARSRLADERPLIFSTVAHVGNIKDHYLDFRGRSPLTELDGWLDTMEMPYKFVENSYWFNGIFERAASDGVGVLLNGGRGNFTVSFGPAFDYYAMLLRRFRFLRLHREMYLYSRNKGIGRRSILQYVRERAFPKSIPASERSHLSRLIDPAFAERTGVYEKLQRSGIDLSGTAIPNMIEARMKQFEEIHHWTNSGTSGTKLSLRHRLWYRDPTNDLRVIRFCLGVPLEQYVRDGMDRALIRRSTAGLLPDAVRLNYRTRGIQGADGIQRMASSWQPFVQEMEQLCQDPQLGEWINMSALREIVAKYRKVPDPRKIYDAEFAMMMRSLIVYRFANRLRGGERNEQRVDETFAGSA